MSGISVICVSSIIVKLSGIVNVVGVVNGLVGWLVCVSSMMDMFISRYSISVENLE